MSVDNTINSTLEMIVRNSFHAFLVRAQLPSHAKIDIVRALIPGIIIFQNNHVDDDTRFIIIII